MALLEKEYSRELKILGVTLPKTDKIPCVRFDEAKKQVAEKYNREIRNPYDLEPEEEALIGQYYKEECDADFVFITHSPLPEAALSVVPYRFQVHRVAAYHA